MAVDPGLKKRGPDVDDLEFITMKDYCPIIDTLSSIKIGVGR